MPTMLSLQKNANSIFSSYSKNECDMERWVKRTLFFNFVYRSSLIWNFGAALLLSSALIGYEARSPVSNRSKQAASLTCDTALDSHFKLFPFNGRSFSLSVSKRFKKKIHFSSIQEFLHIPYSDQEGIVLKYRRLKISGANQPYNPSIVRTRDGYLVAFRNDRGAKGKRKCFLAVARLNAAFRQVGKTVVFRSKQMISEDPRCFFVDNQLYLLYSHVHTWNPYVTYMAMASLDQSTLRLSGRHDLQYHPQRVEKNWVPFVVGSDVHFLYSVNPYKILKLSKIGFGDVEETYFSLMTNNLAWESKWGKISGGTPALLVNDEYLSFFHSSFWSRGVKWYVMGAYTFSKTFPFQLKRISAYPIVFKKMYSTPTNPNAWFRSWREFRVVFPGGFVEGRKNQKEVFHLAFGENDSGLCILTLDKNLLLQSLQDVACLKMQK